MAEFINKCIQLDKFQLEYYLDVVDIIGRSNVLNLLVPILQKYNKCFYQFRMDALLPENSETKAWLETLEDVTDKLLLTNFFKRLNISNF